MVRLQENISELSGPSHEEWQEDKELRPGRKTRDKQHQSQMCRIRISWEQTRKRTPSSKDTLKCYVSIKCRKLPAKMVTKKKEMKEIWGFEVCFFSPSHLLYTPKSSKYIQGHLDPEFSLYTLWGKRYLTYKMIDCGDCKAARLQQLSVLCCLPPSSQSVLLLWG